MLWGFHSAFVLDSILEPPNHGASNVTYSAEYTLNTKTNPVEIDRVSERNGEKMKAWTTER